MLVYVEVDSPFSQDDGENDDKCYCTSNQVASSA